MSRASSDGHPARGEKRYLLFVAQCVIMHFKNLLLAVLETAATKREAKQYITKYGPNAVRKQVCLVRLSGHGIERTLAAGSGRALGRTLAYVRELGAFPIVLLDGNPEIQAFLAQRDLTLKACEQRLWAQSHKMSSYLHDFNAPTMTLVTPFELSATAGIKLNQKWLKDALDFGRIPVLLPTMYDQDTNDLKLYNSYDACLRVAELLPQPYQVDKVVFVDELGGLPSTRRQNAAHVLVNLQQEYREIGAEIRLSSLPDDIKTRHIANLDAMQRILASCGTHTTGLITTADASGTTARRNPIIHNVITDRPLISPSLPTELEKTQLKTSLLRTGLQVYVRVGADRLDLRKEDKVGNISLTKLQTLLENSFKRKFDMEHYLNRVQESVAAIIVVGDYAGCAIITWETAPLTGRRIAYLDKLAVDPTAQGAHNVADIMLIQMIRRLFPQEILWRSRKTNRVNKWYFERSSGHKLLPDSDWTMFWIGGHDVPPVKEYESVCTNIQASLAEVKP